MENKNVNFNFPKVILTKVLVAMVILTGFVACGDKGGSSNNAPPAVVNPVGTIPPCANCGGLNGSVLTTATSTTPIAGTWVLTGDSATMQMIQQNFPSATLAAIYNGHLAITATLNIATNMQIGTCVIPAGSYAVGTSSLGIANYGTFAVPSLTAVSGANQFVFSFVDGVLYNHVQSVSGFMAIQTANGMPCYGQVYIN